MERITRRLVRARQKMRSIVKKVAFEPATELRPPVAAGPDAKKFRDPQTALMSWNDKQMQWWYFTGHLKAKTGERFAYQLVFFERNTHLDYIGVVPSRWLAPRLFAAHFAITSIDEKDPKKQFRYWHRGGFFENNLSYASQSSFHVEVGGWAAYEKPDGGLHLHATAEGQTLSLELTSQKDLCYHGKRGFSQRGADPQVASYYCAFTRLHAKGKLVIDGHGHTVEGSSWMDHEKMLASQEVLIHGWNWLSLQLKTKEELMLYLFKDKNGEIDFTFSFGSWVNKDGSTTHIKGTDIQIEVLESWTSPRSKAKYPIRQKFTVKSLDLEIETRPLVPDSELEVLKTSFSTYWEGAVEAHGFKKSKTIDGHGFLELVGYDKRHTTRLVHFMVVPEHHEDSPFKD